MKLNLERLYLQDEKGNKQIIKLYLKRLIEEEDQESLKEEATKESFIKIITDVLNRERKPFKPKDGDTYYFVSMGTMYTQEGAIRSDSLYSKSTYDLALLHFRNCFRTEKEAARNREKILAKYREVQEQLDE